MKIGLKRELPSLIALAVLYLSLAIAAPGFFAISNLRDVALANVPVLLIASGMTLVIIVGQIDISVGSLFAVTAVLLGLLAKGGMPVVLLPVAAVLLGAVFGSLNGWLIAFAKAPSIVVTLAAMVALREALRWLTAGAWVEGLPANFQWFGFGQSGGQLLIVTFALLLFLLLWWGSQNLPVFRVIYATGSDAEAARLAGIPTTQVVFWVFVLIGALTGFGSLLNAVRFSDIPANGGVSLELDAIAAVVVGGTPITGGQGSLLGTLIGVALLGSIGPALTFLGINPYWVKAIEGSIILITVFLDALSARRTRRMATA